MKDIMKEVPCELVINIMIYLNSEEIFKKMIIVDKNIKLIVESEIFLEKHFMYNGNERSSEYYRWNENIKVLKNMKNKDDDDEDEDEEDIIVNNNIEKLDLIRKIYRIFNRKAYKYFKKSKIIDIFVERKYDVIKERYIVLIDSNDNKPKKFSILKFFSK